MIRLLCAFLTMIFVILSYSSENLASYKSNVQKLVEKKAKEVSDCKKKNESKAKKIKGRMTLLWVIDENGKASSFSRGPDTIDNSEFYHCIEKAISGWKFPRPPFDQSVDIEHEFIF